MADDDPCKEEDSKLHRFYIIKSHVVHNDRSRECLVPHATIPAKKDPQTIVRGSYPVHFSLQRLSHHCYPLPYRLPLPHSLSDPHVFLLRQIMVEPSHIAPPRPYPPYCHSRLLQPHVGRVCAEPQAVDYKHRLLSTRLNNRPCVVRDQRHIRHVHDRILYKEPKTKVWMDPRGSPLVCRPSRWRRTTRYRCRRLRGKRCRCERGRRTGREQTSVMYLATQSTTLV